MLKFCVIIPNVRVLFDFFESDFNIASFFVVIMIAL